MSGDVLSGCTPRAFPVDSASPTLQLFHPSPDLWVIELCNGVENRLARRFMADAILPALEDVKEQWERQKGPGALIITGNRKQEKFFCNGLVVEELVHDKELMPVLDAVSQCVLTYPCTPFRNRGVFGASSPYLERFPSVPVICAMNGHTFAAGLVLALSCDYRVMTSGKAWCCMNEIHFGAPLPATVTTLLRTKLPDPTTVRQCALEGHRFTAQEALSARIVDELADGGAEGVLAAAVKLADKVKDGAKTGVWGLIKAEIYSDILKIIEEGRRTDFSSAKL